MKVFFIEQREIHKTYYAVQAETAKDALEGFTNMDLDGTQVFTEFDETVDEYSGVVPEKESNWLQNKYNLILEQNKAQ